MLVELAIGDAYGAGFEYAHRDLVERHNRLSGYVQHPRHGTKPGAYTDDTQMTLAIAELLVDEIDWTPLNIADRFVKVFHRDPREGYAKGFYNFLQSVRDGEQFLAQIRPDSDKSGAAMRAAPLGVLETPQKVLNHCEIQAAVTHNTPDGIHAAQAAALLVHYFLYKLGEKHEVGTFIEAHVSGDWNTDWQSKVKSKGWMSVRAAITAVKENHKMSNLLKACVAYTGDVDTVATIALAAAAHSQEYEQDLPDILYSQLESGKYGMDYLLKLNNQLLELLKK